MVKVLHSPISYPTSAGRVFSGFTRSACLCEVWGTEDAPRLPLWSGPLWSYSRSNSKLTSLASRKALFSLFSSLSEISPFFQRHFSKLYLVEYRIDFKLCSLAVSVSKQCACIQNLCVIHIRTLYFMFCLPYSTYKGVLTEHALYRKDLESSKI